MALNTFGGVTLSELGLAYSIPVFYSTNVWVKFFIAERYRRKRKINVAAEPEQNVVLQRLNLRQDLAAEFLAAAQSARPDENIVLRHYDPGYTPEWNETQRQDGFQWQNHVL